LSEISLSKEEEIKALEIHKRSIVVLTHIDTVIFWAPRPNVVPFYFDLIPWPEEMSLGKRTGFGHVDLPRILEGGVSCPVFALAVTPNYMPERSLMRSMELLDAFYRELEKNRDRVFLATTVDEVVKAKKNGRVSAMLAIEGGEAIEGNLAALRMLHRLGVRLFGLTHNYRNKIADGMGEARTGSGLTEFGVELISELNKLQIVVDVSHLSDPGFWDVIEVSKDPIIASHSNARSLCNHLRNLTDDQLKAVAEGGGVVGVNFYPEVVHVKEPSLGRVLDHFDYLIDLVGVDYVGVGSDYDGMRKPPVGLEDISKMLNVTRGLMSRGYSEDEIEKILGGNFLRIFKNVIG
jgi:membrane dipeptidase